MSFLYHLHSKLIFQFHIIILIQKLMTMKPAKLFPFVAMAIVFAISISSCKKDARPDAADAPRTASNAKNQSHGFAENDMVLYWNEKAAIVLNAPISPPAQSRYFAIIQIAVHDALNAIKPKFETFALHHVKQRKANPDAAVASAAYWTIKGMNVEGTNPIDEWYAESLGTIVNGEDKDLGIAIGKQSADAIIANRSSDNFVLANRQIPLPDGIVPGEYRSTLPFSNAGMPKIKALDQWGKMMTPFVTKSNSQFRPTAPYPVNSAEYAADYNEVKAKGAKTGHNRTPEEDEIGRFWVERSTIGWNRFARNMVAQKKLDAWKTARLFALLHTAMTDAIGGIFEAKYYYFYWRPETAIRLADTDGNANTQEDANWLPSYIESPNIANPEQNLYTPPIPDYPSAHAGFGGAASEVLKLFFETNNISVNQTSSTTPGITRRYSTLLQAARDNSLSRIYVGFHFRNACLKGEMQGREIGKFVFNNSFHETGDEVD